MCNHNAVPKGLEQGDTQHVPFEKRDEFYKLKI